LNANTKKTRDLKLNLNFAATTYKQSYLWKLKCPAPSLLIDAARFHRETGSKSVITFIHGAGAHCELNCSSTFSLLAGALSDVPPAGSQPASL
jgi:hypothetical protein